MATEPPADPYFDSQRNAWILSRYRDVAAALREPALIPALASSTAAAAPIDASVHAEFRAQALRALSPAAIQQWEQNMTLSANLMAGALPLGEPVDLMEHYARPWALRLAASAAQVSSHDCERLATVGRSVFDAACKPYDDAWSAAARIATVELAAFFQAAPPWTMQMFIALAHSLPAFLGNAWLAMLEQPVEITDLPKAVDELLRFAGPAKAQFRQAVAPVTIGDCTIPQNGRSILRLDIANRDPEVFPDPHTLRFDRRGPSHLAFGTGLHACVGAALIKSAAAAATNALRDRCHLGDHVATPIDHFGVRYLSCLKVILTAHNLGGSA